MNDKDLIQEARRWIEIHQDNSYQCEAAKRMKRLTDALEARQVDEARIRTLIDRAIRYASENAGLSNDERWEIRDEATRAVVEFLGERHEPEPLDCSIHKPVQHRDGKPPWCKECGLDANGNEPVSRLGKPEPVAPQPSENLVYEPRQDAALPWSGVKITPSENEVREWIAGEIEADLEDGSSCIQHVYFAEGMRHAAEIARSGR